MPSLTVLHLASIWESFADEFGDDPALIHGDRVITWAELDDRASRVSASFVAAGLGVGSVVAIDLYNRPEFIEVFFAAIKGGMTPTMVNYRYRADELRHLLNDAQVELVVVETELADSIRSVSADVPTLRHIIELGDGYHELLSATPARRIERDGLGEMLAYTGGTTGLPKGVTYELPRLSNQALALREMVCGVSVEVQRSPVDAARDLRRRRATPVCCPASPLMHGTGFTFISLPTLTAGGTVVTLESRSFDADHLLDAIDRSHITAVGVVGDAFAIPIADALDRRTAGGSSLRVMVSAGVAFAAHTKRRLLSHLPDLAIVDAAGSTEGGTFGQTLTRSTDVPTSVKFEPAAGTMIVDDHRRPVPDGVVGRISAVTFASGYHRQPEQTAETFYDDGGDRRVVPGDFGRIEADGSLTLLGRGSSVINTGGEKVYAEEVEDVIKRLRGVEDAVVCGAADDRLGAVVAALVVRAPGVELDASAIQDHVRCHLAGYKSPRSVGFVARIPRRENGKIDYEQAAVLIAASTGELG